MCALVEFNETKRCKRGRVVAPSTQAAFRVVGTQNGVVFDRTFPSVAAWRSYKRLQREEIQVRHMGTVQA